MESSTAILRSILRMRNPNFVLYSLHFHSHMNRSRIHHHIQSSSSSSTTDRHSFTRIHHHIHSSREREREKQLERWTSKLNRGFSPEDVVEALEAQPDPDLALHLFRWASLQRRYKHNHLSYLSLINILIAANRHLHVETLLAEVLAGSCEITAPLYNSLISYCCSRTLLFHRAFDLYTRMLKSQDCNPTLETYSLLFTCLVKRLHGLHVCHLYLPAVRSLENQMRFSGVVPDAFLLNLIVNAYTKCLQVDEALRVFREMGLYGCHPNRYTYGYIVKGLCDEGRLVQCLGFYKEMRSKGLVPMSSTCLVLICSLSVERMFDDAIHLVFDHLDTSLSPDFLSYKTLLEELCRAGRIIDASKLLQEFRKRDPRMSHKTYKVLLNVLHL